MLIECCCIGLWEPLLGQSLAACCGRAYQGLVPLCPTLSWLTDQHQSDQARCLVRAMTEVISSAPSRCMHLVHCALSKCSPGLSLLGIGLSLLQGTPPGTNEGLSIRHSPASPTWSAAETHLAWVGTARRTAAQDMTWLLYPALHAGEYMDLQEGSSSTLKMRYAGPGAALKQNTWHSRHAVHMPQSDQGQRACKGNTA